MAYDTRLAERIRSIVGDDLAVSEKAMFGGLAFLVNGNMSVTVSGRNVLMIRLDAETAEPLVDPPGVVRTEMRGRVMTGWLDVDPAMVAEDDDLARWVDLGLDFAQTLPPKR